MTFYASNTNEPSARYALRCFQHAAKKRTIYVLQNRTVLKTRDKLDHLTTFTPDDLRDFLKASNYMLALKK